MSLTQQQIKNTPIPDTGRTVLTDGRGLQLRITSNDLRTWSLQYRFNGRMRKISLGQWPTISLPEARKLADANRFKITQGIDPQAEKKSARQDKRIFTNAWEMFDALHISEKKAKTAREYRRSAKVDIIPHFKSVPLKEITKSDVVSLIDKIRKRAPVMANRTLALLNKFFNWCLGRDYINSNPAAHIPKATEHARERVLSLEELRTLYKASSKLSAGNELLIKLMLLTGQRENAIARLEQSEWKGTYLEISGDRNKSGTRIKVHLSEASQKLLAKLGTKEGKYLVSTTGGHKPISGFSKLKKKLDALTGIEEHWTFHDIRGGIATYLEENGLDRIYTSRILNHKDTSTTGIYARPEHRQYFESVFEKWSQVLASNDGLSGENILVFAR